MIWTETDCSGRVARLSTDERNCDADGHQKSASQNAALCVGLPGLRRPWDLDRVVRAFVGRSAGLEGMACDRRVRSIYDSRPERFAPAPHSANTIGKALVPVALGMGVDHRWQLAASPWWIDPGVSSGIPSRPWSTSWLQRGGVLPPMPEGELISIGCPSTFILPPVCLAFNMLCKLCILCLTSLGITGYRSPPRDHDARFA